MAAPPLASRQLTRVNPQQPPLAAAVATRPARSPASLLLGSRLPARAIACPGHLTLWTLTQLLARSMHARLPKLVRSAELWLVQAAFALAAIYGQATGALPAPRAPVAGDFVLFHLLGLHFFLTLLLTLLHQ
eukprot:scaffold81166_cov78-Phaeocystis_antarctica.AAC.1